MSVKVTSIKECLHWPLEVFGIIAVRDVLDHKRNIIFHRPRSNCQTITQDVSILLIFALCTTALLIIFIIFSAFASVWFRNSQLVMHMLSDFVIPVMMIKFQFVCHLAILVIIHSDLTVI
jgi:hypothetical protein